MNNQLSSRCGKTYEVNKSARMERCVLESGHVVPCQITLWWSLKVPALEPGVGTVVDGGEITVRRVE